MGDVFEMPNFEEIRHDALVALVTSFPQQLLRPWTLMFHAPNMSVEQRVLVLAVIRKTAQALSAVAEEPTVENAPIVDNPKTRRFISIKPQKKTFKNIFAGLASVVFFILLEKSSGEAGFTSSSGLGPIVEGELLRTLAVVLESGGPAMPNLVEMQSEALDALHSFQSPDTYLQQNALFLLWKVCLLTPRTRLSSGFPVEWVFEWLQRTMLSADETCRNLATSLIHLI
eukprot:Platyproteum_vivax@DN3251_c0_g1_i1.p3